MEMNNEKDFELKPQSRFRGLLSDLNGKINRIVKVNERLNVLRSSITNETRAEISETSKCGEPDIGGSLDEFENFIRILDDYAERLELNVDILSDNLG